MLFFDKHNMIVQYRLKHALNEMEQEVDRYAMDFEATQLERLELETDHERYAREKYFMHKPDEEVFVVVRE